MDPDFSPDLLLVSGTMPTFGYVDLDIVSGVQGLNFVFFPPSSTFAKKKPLEGTARFAPPDQSDLLSFLFVYHGHDTVACLVGYFENKCQEDQRNGGRKYLCMHDCSDMV